MGSVGDSYDNALAENLWSTIKTECIRGRVFATRAEANLALFEYLDGLHNPRRIQKRLGYLSPIEYEEKHYAEQAAAERTNLNTHQPQLTNTSRATGEALLAQAGPRMSCVVRSRFRRSAVDAPTPSSPPSSWRAASSTSPSCQWSSF
ncbi:IS3 family transposase [Streptomyces sp. NBC_01017]|uniref:IS3 family transposase n=1 Tax=Streptomyces sp. NBC_01017 TaxID=2903721 RepID=UPI00386FCA4B